MYPCPSWIHSDIMDDNILIEGITKLNSSGERERVYEADQEKMNAIQIIDFSDLSIGELTIISTQERHFVFVPCVTD